MNTTQTIFDSLHKSGVYLWEIDYVNRTISLSDSLRYMLGFKDGVITLGAFTTLMPEDFRAGMTEKLTRETQWSMPIYSPSGLVWLDVHKIQTITDQHGNVRYMGTARQMTDQEVGNKIATTGINVDTLTPLINAIHLMSESSTFTEGVHVLLETIRHQIIGTKVGLMKWKEGEKFVVIDFVGGYPINKNGALAKTDTYIYSKMCQELCISRNMTPKEVLTENLEDGPEKSFYIRNGIRSTILVPIVGSDNEPWGLIGVNSPTRSVWGAFDKQWISMVSTWVSLSIKRIRLAKQISEQLRITSQAGRIGNFTTWTWDVSERTLRETIYRENGDVVKKYDSETMRKKVHKADFQRYIKVLSQIRSKETDIFDERLRIHNCLTKKMEWYEVKGQVTQVDKDGYPLKVIGISRNINEDIKREQKERADLEFQSSIYNNMQIDVEFYNKEGKLIYMNKTGLALMGVKGSKSVMGMDLFDNPNFDDEIMQALREKNEAIFHFVYDFAKVGKYYKTYRTDTVDVILKTTRLYRRGEFYGYMLMFIDNSELAKQTRQVEIFHRYSLEVGKFAKVGICWFTDSKNEYVSEQWNKNLGIEPWNPFVRNLTPLKHVVDEDLDVYSMQLKRIFVGNIDSFQSDLRVHQDDEILHYIKVQFVRTSEAIIGFSLDVTQSKENEEMLIQARSKAEKADMLKSQFLNNMSHEVRTPLNAIVGFSNLIAQSVETPEAQMYADIVQTNNDILLNIIGDIIDLSKIESNTMEMTFSDCNINNIGSSIYNNYIEKVPDNVELIFSPYYEEIEAYCDKGHITQILNNFISNAIKFTTSGNIHLRIDKEDGDLVFCVTDTGCGIAHDKVEKIFEPYTKLNVFSVGTGLGLPICKALATAMDGKITVESKEGRGSCFKLHIQYIRPEELSKKRHNIGDSCIMLLSNTNETMRFVSFTLDAYNLVLEQDHVFMSLWLEKKPRITIIDQQMFGDSIVDVVQSLHNYGVNHKIIIICPTYAELDIDALETSGVAAIVYTPVTGEKFKDVVARCFV